MQKLTSLVALTLCFGLARAQDPQNQQELKSYLKQIAALRVYISYVEKGYTIAKEGLSAIQRIKKDDFSLHEDYFNSLKRVSPAIERFWKVADIALLEARMLQVIKSTRRHLQQSGGVLPEEINYIEQVWTGIIQGSADILSELLDLTTAGKLALKDDERLKRIDALHEEMKDRYAFTLHFASQASLLSLQHLKDQNALSALGHLYSPN